MSRPCSQAALLLSSLALALLIHVVVAAAPPFVPGTGEFLADICDDFEDENWSYTYNHPKSSHEQDNNHRNPGGRSSNGLWHEGAKRGTPDLVQRVPTPPGGLEGSTGALMIATKNSGIPGRPSNQQQQDDLIMMFNRRLGRSIPISWQPSCTVRVYLPPWEHWEQRTGPSFGLRADCWGQAPGKKAESYWPGMFLLFQSSRSRNVDEDHARLTIRAGQRGNDVRSHQIMEPGWWTFGMSFTADGQVHYYASPGIEDLTSDDYLMSSFPYNMRAQSFNNFFFNVANWDNGRTWSTPWVIDDPMVFVIPPPGQEVANLYRTQQNRQQTTRQQVNRGRSNQPSTNRSPGSAARGRTQR